MLGTALLRCLLLAVGSVVLQILLFIAFWFISRDELFALGLGMMWWIMFAIGLVIACIFELVCDMSLGLSWNRWWIVMACSCGIPAILALIIGLLQGSQQITF